MRVLFIVYRDVENPEAVGGDFYLWELARGLSELGHNVTVLSSSFPGSKLGEKKDGVNIIRIQGSLSLPSKVFGTYLSRFKGRFDAVIEEVIGGQRLPFLGAIFVREPLLVVWHQRNDRVFREQYPFFVALPLSFFEFVLACLYKKKTVLTPSIGAKKELESIGLRGERVRVIHDGVSERFLDVSLNEERKDVVVCLGKLRRYKRIDHAVLAHAKVAESLGRGVRLVIAGKISEIDRGYLDRLKKLARKLGITEQIEFRVNISEEQKMELLRKAKVLVQPSPVEGFSIVVVEANRCGVPVVVSDGVPFDVVHDGFNGLKYPYGNIEAFAAAIATLLNDSDTWSRMSRNAYEWSRQFTWKTSAARLEEILANTIVRSQVTSLPDRESISNI